MRTKYLTIILAALMAGLGCDNDPAGTDGGMPPTDGGDDMVDSGGGGDQDAGGDDEEDAGPDEDGNDTFDTATPIEIITADGTATQGVIDPAGDLDYYSFEGTEGQWIQILTGTDGAGGAGSPDTAITLFDSTMTQIADNDDSLPRVGTDAGLITRLPADGTYYVLIQEWSTWSPDSDEPLGGADWGYGLGVFELTADGEQTNVDAEAGDDTASAQALTEAAGTMGGGSSYVLGTFDDATDVDVYSFTIPAGGASVSYSVNLMPHGTDGNGAGAAPTAYWITNGDGSEIIARLDPAAFEPLPGGVNVDLAPSLAPGDYLLHVSAGSSAGEATSFYVLKAFRSTADNPPEAAEATNNLPATPEAIDTPPNTMVPGLRSGFILSSLAADDTDHFSITTMEGEAVTVSCGSRSLGSGVVDLTVTLLEADGLTEITSATETATEGVLIQDQAVSAAGTYVVRLESASQDSEVTGTWVRCGFHLQPPAAP